MKPLLLPQRQSRDSLLFSGVDEDGERIPLTVGYDRARGTIKIIFQIVGATTAKLNHKNEGEYIQDFVRPRRPHKS